MKTEVPNYPHYIYIYIFYLLIGTTLIEKISMITSYFEMEILAKQG